MKTKSSTKQTTSGKQKTSGKQATSAKQTTAAKHTTTAKQPATNKPAMSAKPATAAKQTTTATKSATKSNKLSTADRKQLRSSDFGIPEKREYPMPDAAHVHAAEAYFRHASASDKPLLAHRIVMKAKKYGVELDSDKIKEWAKKYKA